VCAITIRTFSSHFLLDTSHFFHFSFLERKKTYLKIKKTPVVGMLTLDDHKEIFEKG